MYKLPERGGGGILGNARKKTFFFKGGVPLLSLIIPLNYVSSGCLNLMCVLDLPLHLVITVKTQSLARSWNTIVGWFP